MEQPPDDASLIRQAQQGDTQAFDQLALRYRQMVFAVALRLLRHYHDADNATWTAFAKAWEQIRTFKGDSRFPTWLYRITRNACYDLLRQRAREKKLVATSIGKPGGKSKALYVPTRIPSPRQQAIRNEEDELLRKALNKLDTLSRTIVELKDLEGLTYEEVAQVVRRKVGTVQSRHARAFRRLRKILRKWGVER